MEDYRHQIYNTYLTSGFEDMNATDFKRTAKAYDLNMNFIINQLPKDAHILDIGCGMGHFLYYLSAKGFKNFCGVDIGKEQVIFCQEKLKQNAILISDLTDYLKKQPNTFDLIVMNDNIEHFKKAELGDILIAVKNALKSSGQLYLKTPNMGNLLAASARYIDITHEIGFTEVSLRQLLMAYGFSNVQVFEEKVYIQSWYKRPIFNFVRKLYLFCLKLLVQIERPGDNFPTILTKNLITVAHK